MNAILTRTTNFRPRGRGPRHVRLQKELARPTLGRPDSRVLGHLRRPRCQVDHCGNESELLPQSGEATCGRPCFDEILLLAGSGFVGHGGSSRDCRGLEGI